MVCIHQSAIGKRMEIFAPYFEISIRTSIGFLKKLRNKNMGNLWAGPGGYR